MHQQRVLLQRRLRGRRVVIGLMTFYAACFVGAVVNVRIAQFTKDAGVPWYLAGACGLAVGAVWNYGVTSITTWRQARERAAMPVKPGLTNLEGTKSQS